MSFMANHGHCKKCHICIYLSPCLIYKHPKTECENSEKKWFSGSIEINWFDERIQEQWIEF